MPGYVNTISESVNAISGSVNAVPGSVREEIAQGLCQACLF